MTINYMKLNMIEALAMGGNFQNFSMQKTLSSIGVVLSMSFKEKLKMYIETVGSY